MFKKKIYAVAVMATMMLAACNNSSPKMDQKPEPAECPHPGMRIAYVEVDSIMTQYQYCKEYSILLEKKSNNARNTLNQKGKQLEAAAANFQRKLQNNGFTSREQAEAAQAGIQKSQQDLQELQARLANELEMETAKFNDALRDSIQNFLNSYNKDKKFDLILSKAGDNILLADKRFDITDDVVKGLNKRYKKDGAAKKDAAKTENSKKK